MYIDVGTSWDSFIILKAKLKINVSELLQKLFIYLQRLFSNKKSVSVTFHISRHEMSRRHEAAKLSFR
jgi:hypothetical protein